jgi:predicted nucleic acid-binding protein
LTSVVVDASVAFKWLIPDRSEADVPAAKAILAEHMEAKVRIVVPSLLFYEVGNILLYGRVRPPAAQVEGALADLFLLPLEVVSPTASDAQAASGLAAQHGITFYDATYLALAESQDCDFVTADGRLYRKVRGPHAGGPSESRIKLLARSPSS